MSRYQSFYESDDDDDFNVLESIEYYNKNKYQNARPRNGRNSFVGYQSGNNNWYRNNKTNHHNYTSVTSSSFSCSESYPSRSSRSFAAPQSSYSPRSSAAPQSSYSPHAPDTSVAPQSSYSPHAPDTSVTSQSSFPSLPSLPKSSSTPRSCSWAPKNTLKDNSACPVVKEPAPENVHIVGDLTTPKEPNKELVEKYNSNTFQFATKQYATTKNNHVRVTVNMVRVLWHSKTPKSIYKYDLKMTVYVAGVPRKSVLNKEETLTVLCNLEKDEQAKQILNTLFWSDLKGLFYAFVNIPKSSFMVPLDERRNVDVTITPTETITITNLDTDADPRFIQALSNSLSYEATVDKKLVCNKSQIFNVNAFPLQPGWLEAFRGVNYNFRDTEQGLMLSIDTCTSAFICPGPLMNAIEALCGYNYDKKTGTIGPQSLRDLTVLTDIKVYATHERYEHKYTIKKITSINSKDAKFTLQKEGQEDREISVYDYFAEEYNLKLKYPYAPLVETTNKKLLPIELLYIKPHQRYKHLLEPKHTSKMITIASVSPFDHKSFIQNFVQSDGARYRRLNNFDIEISSRLQETVGRILPSPTLKCGRFLCEPSNGAWNNKGLFVTTKSITNCITVFLDKKANPDDCMHLFFSELNKIIRIPPPTSMKVITHTPLSRLEGELSRIVNTSTKKVDFLFFFIAGVNPGEYKEIKRISDTVLKIPSQCIVCFQMKKMLKKGYVSNIAMKINAKLGGKNTICKYQPIDLTDVMVCGADVTHPMPGEKCLSVASIVGSFDKDYTQYAGEARVQKGRKEIITDMVDMMQSLFSCYYCKNNSVPKSVIFYRDGVADQMFDLVLHEEIPKIYIAFHSIFPTYPDELKLTFIICQKRHSTKFYPERSSTDRTGNAYAGLVVDQDIVSKTHTEFYLQSHAAIRGTCRSCRYTTLLDDNNIQLDSLESFTFALCHLFNRCNRSIGICAPARYAHHLCFRARDILKVSDGDSENGNSTSISTDRAIEAFDFDYAMKDKMFYV